MAPSVITAQNFIYIRTYKGNHLIAEINKKDSTFYYLDFPMEIGFAYDDNGVGTSIFQEWIPLDFFDDSIIPFKRVDSMVEKTPTTKLIVAYLEWRLKVMEQKQKFRRAKEENKDQGIEDVFGEDLGYPREVPKKRYLN